MEENIVKKYLDNETGCFQEWYKEYYSLELYPGEACVAMPNMDEIRTSFAEWFKHRRGQLFNLICVEWNYPAKIKDPKFEKKAYLAAAIADLLVSSGLKILSPVTTSVILVQMGLDRLCQCEHES